MGKDKVKIVGENGSEVNFEISQYVELITLANGVALRESPFKVALPVDATEGATIKVKLRSTQANWVTIPVYLGGWNNYNVVAIDTEGHTGATTIYIGR